MVAVEFFYDGYGKVYPYVRVPVWEIWRLFGIRRHIARLRWQLPMVTCELGRVKIDDDDWGDEAFYVNLPDWSDMIKADLWLE